MEQTKKIQGILVARFFCFNSRVGNCNYYSLGMAHPHPPFPNHSVCEGDEYHVKFL